VVSATKARKIIDKSIANALAGIGLLLAVGALLFLTFWTGFYHGEAVSPDGNVVQETSASLIEENGMDVLGVLIFPVVLSLIGLLASFSQTKAGKIGMWVSAILLLLFGLVTWISLGPFYLPAGLTLVIAAISARTSNRQQDRQSGAA
jgi:cytochrome bd-type quinol oxidase subunit 2